MEILTIPETPEQASLNMEKMILIDKIQKAYNRSQYDRTLGQRGMNIMYRSMHVLEMNYSELYGKEGENAS